MEHSAIVVAARDTSLGGVRLVTVRPGGNGGVTLAWGENGVPHAITLSPTDWGRLLTVIHAIEVSQQVG